MITAIEVGSPASSTGLETGDKLISVNDSHVQNVSEDELSRLLNALTDCQEVVIGVSKAISRSIDRHHSDDLDENEEISEQLR
jgi:S1-C subfamily serine protease